MNQSQSGTSIASAVVPASSPEQGRIVLMGSGIISPTIKAHLAKTVAAQQARAPAAVKPIVLTGSGIISPTIKAHLAKQFR
ncbi:MAG TPA: hypothetical protein VLJ57_10185 [Burkholderiaceae bacterium]|nr:hypothetical protein [Burkholderiaceae bacterium]